MNLHFHIPEWLLIFGAGFGCGIIFALILVRLGGSAGVARGLNW